MERTKAARKGETGEREERGSDSRGRKAQVGLALGWRLWRKRSIGG